MKGSFSPPTPLDPDWEKEWRKTKTQDANPGKETVQLGDLKRGDRFQYGAMSGTVRVSGIVAVVPDGSKDSKNWSPACPVVAIPKKPTLRKRELTA